MIQQYEPRPATYVGVQFTGDNVKEIADALGIDEDSISLKTNTVTPWLVIDYDGESYLVDADDYILSESHDGAPLQVLTTDDLRARFVLSNQQPSWAK